MLNIGGLLELEHAPFGTAAPIREHVDNNVFSCVAIDSATVYALDTDANLWLEHAPFGGKIPPKREHVDGNVHL